LKRLKKILIYTAVVLAILFASAVISVFLFKDKIIQRFVTEANKHLNTPVKIGKIDVSMFDDFPNLAIVLTDVYVEDSHPGIYPLLTAQRMAFTLKSCSTLEGQLFYPWIIDYRQ
jgi:hypothetical protein